MDIFDAAGDDEGEVRLCKLCPHQLCADSLQGDNPIPSSSPSTARPLRAISRQERRATRQIPRRSIQVGLNLSDTTYSDEIRFIESESDLDSALKQFLPLTQNPPLFYPELVKSGTVALLTNLLSHDNTDIAIDVVEVVQELTDEDVGAGAEVDDLEEEGGEGSTAGMATRTRLAMAEFIDELVSSSVASGISLMTE